jgi:hypothetical protein
VLSRKRQVGDNKNSIAIRRQCSMKKTTSRRDLAALCADCAEFSDCDASNGGVLSAGCCANEACFCLILAAQSY